ncbi:1131_t:CDS:2 [Gigaspora margarita]|uniref:1131_t:CDS:1 n=1 Tax=Gigaspora margarita TaxID=4874 RepID=A0ABN7W9S8_GIGMA|nr:1131_t:CDS:2 [Gigaspora margarita]
MEPKHLYGSIDYTSLVKARNTLHRVLENAHSEDMDILPQDKFCYELSWKILKKILNFHSIEVDKRNITVHCYQEEILDDLFANTAKEFLQDLDQLLVKYPYRFYAYGSRVKGTARKFSDLDLCYQENIPENILSHLREDFEESNLPFKVDLVN